MTATADFRQMAQYIGLAMCSLIMRTAFWVFGIIWGIVREIVNGVFRVAIGVIFHNRLFRLHPLVIHPLILNRHGKEKKQDSRATMQIL